MKKIAYYLLVGLVTIVLLFSVSKIPSSQAGHNSYPPPALPTGLQALPLSYPAPIPTAMPLSTAIPSPIMSPMEEDTSYIDWAILEGQDNVWFFCGSCNRDHPEYYIGEASVWYREHGHYQYTIIIVYLTYYGVEEGTGKPVFLGHTNLNICTEFELHSASMRLASPFEDWDADNLPVWNTWCGNFLPIIEK